jgi:hypothetical protein
VPQIAHFGVVAAFRTVLVHKIKVSTDTISHKSATYLIIALERLEVADSVHWCWIANPLKGLPVGDNINILHGVDCVQEFDETLLVMRLCEPSSMVEQTKRRTVCRIVTFEIFHNHLEDIFDIGWVRTGVTHRTPTSVQILPHHHGHFPNTGVAFSWAGWDHAVVEDFVVQRVRVAGRAVLIHRHRRVISEVEVVQHFEHFVATNRQEGSTHTCKTSAWLRIQDFESCDLYYL